MHLPERLVFNDYDGQLALAPAMMRSRELADVTILLDLQRTAIIGL
jgi:hypothetical protein